MSDKHIGIRRVVSLSVCTLIRSYQLLLSPLLGPRCRFYPSCSNYMLQAIEHYGLVKGLWLGVKRLARCHPFSDGGYDPIPKDRAESCDNDSARNACQSSEKDHT